MNWTEFLAAAPEVRDAAVERVEKLGLALLGTLRQDGSPRISPCEMLVFEDDLLFGMMWRSTKALDLVRDSRCLLHSIVSDKAGTEGELKLRGRVTDVADTARRRRYVRTVRDTTGFEPKEPFHLFALDIREASYIRYVPSSGDQQVMHWREGGSVVSRLRRFNGSGLED